MVLQRMNYLGGQRMSNLGLIPASESGNKSNIIGINYDNFPLSAHFPVYHTQKYWISQ